MARISAGLSAGILTVGGSGGQSSVRSAVTAGGGHGGSITITNNTDGQIDFGDVDLITGAGVEEICDQVFMHSEVFFFRSPTGGLGARGSLNGGSSAVRGGDGGKGGDAGNIIITGSIRDLPAKPTPTQQTIYGHDGENSENYYHASYQVSIGQSLTFSSSGDRTLFEANTIGGSGGAPGGHATSLAGTFGHKGSDGTLRIMNSTGQQVYP